MVEIDVDLSPEVMAFCKELQKKYKLKTLGEAIDKLCELCADKVERL
jgi:hypothetical protein